MSTISRREAASLLIPVLRTDYAGDLGSHSDFVNEALELGVGGFALTGGDQESVRSFNKEVQQRSPHPLLIGAELERGAGQCFSGATGLPPLAAISALGDMESLRRAARLTAREARTMGVNWNLAPVADAGDNELNPVLGTRTPAADTAVAARLVAAWVEACQGEGVLACAKHFPGIGRLTGDPQLTASRVDATADALKGGDMVPFRSAIAAGVASIMVPHVAYKALDPSGMPAALSREIVQWLLRQQFKYDNLVVSDSIAMAAATEERSAGEATVLAVRAGCDVVLDPPDIHEAVSALQSAVADGFLDPEVVHLAIRRRLKWAQWVSPPNDWRRPSGADTAWGALLADRVIRSGGRALPQLAAVTEVVIADDDQEAYSGGSGTPGDRRVLLEALRQGGVDAREVKSAGLSSGGPLVIALFADFHPGKGRVTLLEKTVSKVREAITSAARLRRECIVLAFGDERWVRQLRVDVPVVFSWSGDAVMQRAAARHLQRRR